MEPDLLPLDVALAKLADAFAAPETPAIRADRDDPALDRSAMDGAALRSQDGLVPRVILGTLYAGDPPDGFDVLPGTCVRIMTGACLPPGADTIVPVEELRQDAGGLVPLTLPRPGDHLRRQGEQARTGDLLLPAGWRGNAARTGLAAQVGLPPGPCSRVRVGIASTGDELRDAPAPHQIRDSNSPMLSALAHNLGAEAIRLPPLPDDPATLQAFLADLGALDVLITSGGVSVGDKDYLPRALAALGARVLFHKISLKPGKPMLAALLGRKVILGLPGNPVAAYLNALLFLPVAMAGLQGTVCPAPWKTGHLGTALRNPGDRPLLHPCRLLEDRLQPLAFRGSADLITLAQADACVWVPAGGAEAGTSRYVDLL